MIEIASPDWGWTLYAPRRQGEASHVIPDTDINMHLTRSDCWCSPEPDDDDENILIHRAKDGRTAYLMGERDLN